MVYADAKKLRESFANIKKDIDSLKLLASDVEELKKRKANAEDFNSQKDSLKDSFKNIGGNVLELKTGEREINKKIDKLLMEIENNKKSYEASEKEIKGVLKAFEKNKKLDEQLKEVKEQLMEIKFKRGVLKDMGKLKLNIANIEARSVEKDAFNEKIKAVEEALSKKTNELSTYIEDESKSMALHIERVSDRVLDRADFDRESEKNTKDKNEIKKKAEETSKAIKDLKQELAFLTAFSKKMSDRIGLLETEAVVASRLYRELLKTDQRLRKIEDRPGREESEKTPAKKQPQKKEKKGFGKSIANFFTEEEEF